MRETSIMDNLTCKMKAHARVCEENKTLEEKMIAIETICDERCEFEGSYRKSGDEYQDDILKDDST